MLQWESESTYPFNILLSFSMDITKSEILWQFIFSVLGTAILFSILTVSISVQFSSFPSLSHVWLFVTPQTAAHQACLSITNSRDLFKFMSIELVMSSNYLILCHHLLFLPSIFPSITVFSNESVLHIRWSKYWSFRYNISPSSEYSGLISFRMDWLDTLAVQGTLKSLLQHHCSKASVLSFLYSPTLTSIHDCWKNHSLD